MVSYAADLLHQYYDLLMESQYWDTARMRDYQQEQLGHLLRHARSNAPFYASRLDPVFRPDGSIDFDRWRELPILKRQDLVKHRDAMLATNVPPHHGKGGDFSTSGSSGTPITVRTNGMANLASRAAEYRAFDWHRMDFSQVRCIVVSDPAVARWPTGRQGGIWGPRWAYGSTAGRDVEISMYDSYPDILEFVARSEARYLICGSTTAQAMALESERLGMEIALDKILTTGSTPTAPERDACRRVFGARFLQRYASKEAHAIAHLCPVSDQFHIHSETCFVEVLRPDGTPCGPGETGTLVVTPFLSTHQPLIRYEQGDIVTVGEACACGRTLPVLAAIEGRLSHVFRFPDGSTTYRRIPEEYRSRLKARMWQVAQVAPLHIELRYAPVAPDATGDEQAVLDFMRTLYPADVDLSIRRVDQVPLTPAGKLIEYIYEVPEHA